MHLPPITSSSLIERNKLENTSEKSIIKGNIMNVANGDKDFSPPLFPSKQYASLNVLPLPPRGINIANNCLLSRRKINNVDIPKFNFSRSNEEVKLHNERENFLVAVKKCTGTDKYNEKAEILFNNLNSLKYNSSDYQSVENARYGNQLMYRKDTLIKSGNVSLPANDVSSYNSPNMTIASQYPLNKKESLKNYFNMLFDNNINIVYVLASNKDIKKIRSNHDDEYKKVILKKKGLNILEKIWI